MNYNEREFTKFQTFFGKLLAASMVIAMFFGSMYLGYVVVSSIM